MRGRVSNCVPLLSPPSLSLRPPSSPHGSWGTGTGTRLVVVTREVPDGQQLGLGPSSESRVQLAEAALYLAARLSAALDSQLQPFPVPAAQPVSVEQLPMETARANVYIFKSSPVSQRCLLLQSRTAGTVHCQMSMK